MMDINYNPVMRRARPLRSPSAGGRKTRPYDYLFIF